MTAGTHLTLLAASWILYALIHTVLASRTGKSWFQSRFPGKFPVYRLLFNVVAILLLVLPLWLLYSYPGTPLWRWPPILGWLADGAALAAALGFLWTMRVYDSAEFLGLRQLRRSTADILRPTPLRLSWAHRFVRHPWYFFGLVILWTREMNAALLVTALILTLYLAAGSRREESDLIERYGDQYREYRKQVPGLFPLPWRFLSARQARDIVRMADKP